ncbi:hypothetical protein [Streptomyces chrestomyceticus]|uniref:hypothetical protein n=1 Tax=Streptomyces chrestomyceticus TaxID=68185 RepID=UPI0033E998A5
MGQQMAEHEPTGREHDNEERRPDGHDPAALAEAVSAEGGAPATADGYGFTIFEIPAGSASRLGHLERPVKRYAVQKPVPNPLPAPADSEEWLKPFAPDAPRTPRAHGMRRGEATGVPTARELPLNRPALSPGVITRGGTEKTVFRLPAVDLDPHGNAAEWPGGPGIDLCRTCGVSADEPSARCTNPVNHHGAAQ